MLGDKKKKAIKKAKDDLAISQMISHLTSLGVEVEEATLVGGRRMVVHAKRNCKGEHCTIHNPSNHHMVTWPQNWRDDIRIMERICEHSCGHPDPDDIAAKDHRHGCCGCCNPDRVVTNGQ